MECREKMKSEDTCGRLRILIMEDSVCYGYKSITEKILSSMKRIFGDNVSARKSLNMVKEEMMIKASLYNIFLPRIVENVI